MSIKLDKRLYGIDLAKIIAIVMVLFLHILGQGGLVENSVGFSRYLYKAIRMICLCSVDILCISTGLLIAEKTFTWKRIIKVLLSIVAVSIVFLVIGRISNQRLLTGVWSIHNSLTNTYWYVVDYIAILLMMPFLNRFIEILSRDELKKFCLLLFVLFSCVPLIMGRDLFAFNGGYSFIWMVVLYMYGAFLKRVELSRKQKWKVFIAMNALILVLALIQLAFRSDENAFLKHFTDVSVSYLSPFICGMAMAIVILLKDIRVKRQCWKSVIIFFSNATFLAYIIHCNYFFYDEILKGAFSKVAEKNVFIALIIVASTIIVYYLCVAIINVFWMKILIKLKI
jgi:surface polysaccharide O-acyltransferase-like enzyme